ncbi:TraB/GumN family protein [Pelagibius sp. CAU 1746]|uniref:TraB/GumN family protein n=1 Tax=Pelagibius sp. CAU 1746 TaxID=3140370 RepID=UPI00325B0BE1
MKNVFRQLRCCLPRPLAMPPLLLLLATCATPEPLPLPEPLDMPYDQGRIWKIEGEDIKPSYVFGTFHIADSKVLDIPLAAERAFVDSPIAAFEYDYDPAKKEENRIDRERYRLSEGTTLRSLVGARVYGDLTNIIKGLGYWKPNNELKPWVMWDIFGGARGTFYRNDDDSKSGEVVLDGWLQKRARDEGKTVVGLESVEEGFVKYDTIPMDQQVAMLTALVDHYHQERQGAPIVQAYVDGNLGLLMALSEERMSRYPPEVAEMLDFRILTNRNHIFVERALPHMREDSTFVAVGAGHLPGEEGVLRLFEERGYKVTKLH